MTLTPTIGNDPRYAKLGGAKYDFVAFQLRDPESVLNTMTADQIAEFLEIAADAYYNKGDPLISDDLYDLAFEYLRAHYPDHPAGQRIGAPIAVGDRVELPFWMGSLDKIRDDPKALAKWVAQYDDPASYVISDKLDGNSGLLVYTKQGTYLYSRGDGKTGQNVSHLLPLINGIVPVSELQKAKGQGKAKSAPVKLPFAVRGELIISRKNWENIKDLGANARNVVAGAMHAKQPDTRIASKIDFVAYELLEPHETPHIGLTLLKSLGFMVADFHEVSKAQMTMEHLSEMLLARRRDSPYEVDGIVIAHNKEHKRIKGKNPKYAFAFKSILTHDEAEVIVTKVEWNVSKDGYMKPLVHFPTVVIEGAKISKATGFNAGFIEENKIGPGSRILIIRSGSVIPHIVRVLSPASNGKPSFPDVPYTWTPTHVDIMIQEAPSTSQKNPEMVMKQMEYFMKTLDIKNVGPGTIKKLYESGLNTLPKLLAATATDIKKVEGFQSVSATKVAEAIASARSSKCVDLMAASGLFGRGIGVKKLAPVFTAFPKIAEETTPIPTYEELIKIQGMGEVSAKSILEGIAPFRKFLKEIGYSCEATPVLAKRQTAAPTAPAPAPAPLPDMSGKTFVFTGFRSKEWESQITEAGGKVTTSVSKNTTAVVAADPDEDSGKIKKARDLNIPVMSKDEFSKKYAL